MQPFFLSLLKAKLLRKHLFGNKVPHAHTEAHTIRIQKTMAANGMTQRLTKIIAAGKTHMLSVRRASVAVVVEVRGTKSSFHNQQNRL